MYVCRAGPRGGFLGSGSPPQPEACTSILTPSLPHDGYTRHEKQPPCICMLYRGPVMIISADSWRFSSSRLTGKMLMIHTVMLKIASENDYPITPLCVYTESKYSLTPEHACNISDMYCVICLRKCFIPLTSWGNNTHSLAPTCIENTYTFQKHRGSILDAKRR